MNWTRIAYSTIGGFVAYFIVGAVITSVPMVRNEYRLFPVVYRPMEQIKAVMPAGMAAMFVSILVLAILYAQFCRDGGWIEGCASMR